MADIFLSYASEDRERVIPLVEALEADGFSVWWGDRNIETGSAFDREIEKAIDDAGCILVVWSKDSVDSDWVRTEANEGLERKILAPVLIDDVRPPLEFRMTQTTRLIDWPSPAADSEFDKLIARISRLSDKSEDAIRRKQGIIADRPSIVVLPFVNMSSDKEHEYLADGMTEDLITLLSQMPSFIVLSRNSSFAYKGQTPDVRQVGEELGVRYVLEGSIRKMGNRIRVTVQLIECGTRRHLWSEKYDNTLENIFDLQDEIEQGIAATLGTKLRSAAKDRVRRQHPESLDAWGLLVRADQSVDRKEKLDYINQAIALDPNYGGAYASLAIYLSVAYLSGAVPEDERESQAERVNEAAQKAISLSPDNPGLLQTVAMALSWVRQYTRSVQIAKRAAELAPNAGYKQGLVLVLLNAGRVQEAVELGESIWPDLPRDYWRAAELLAQGYNILAQYDQAVFWSDISIDVVPGSPDPWLFRANALVHLGRIDEARDAIHQAQILAHEQLTLAGFQMPYRRVYANEDMVTGLTDGLIDLDFDA